MNSIKSWVLHSVVLFLCAHSAFAQASETAAKKGNLYSVALFASISQMEKSWGYIDDGRGNRVRTDYRRILVRKNPELTDDLPRQFEDYHVEFLDDQALIGKYKTLRKEFSFLQIHPMRSDGQQLKIQVSLSWFKYQKNHLIFAFSDWSDVEFRYDCDKRAYIVSAANLGGI